MSKMLLGEALEDIYPAIPELLVSSESWGAITAIASRLPECMARRTFGLECPLAMPGHADFLVSTSIAHHGAELLSAVRDADVMFGQNQNRAEMIARFGRIWAECDSSHKPLTFDDVWLEFDIIGSVGNVPIPGIFFSPLIRSDACMTDRFESMIRHIRHIHERMSGYGWQADFSRHLAMTLEHFELCGSPEKRFMVGMMLGRTSDALRLVYSAKNVAVIVDFLHKIGWAGDLAALASSLEIWYGMVDHIWMNIDFSDHFWPRIGFELSFARRRLPGLEPRWHDVLEYLVGKGMCTPAQRQALLDYSGCQRSLSRPVMVEPDGRKWAVYWIRNLYHVKIVTADGIAMNAKTYLSCSLYKKELAHVS
jgi:hypothetical protein